MTAANFSLSLLLGISEAEKKCLKSNRGQLVSRGARGVGVGMVSAHRLALDTSASEFKSSPFPFLAGFAQVIKPLWASVFPSVKWVCPDESWTIKKAEPGIIDAFEIWFWRRLFRVPWTARRSNQSILKEINPEYSLKGLMLKLKVQYYGHLTRRANSLEKTLMLRKTEGRRRRG